MSEPVVEPAVEYRVAKSSNTLFSVVVLVIMAVLIGLTAYEGRRERHQVRRATECLIEQLAEHRDSNRSAHQSTAERLGAHYKTEAEDLPPFAIDHYREACKPFLKDRP